jgi:hypothetical protein
MPFCPPRLTSTRKSPFWLCHKPDHSLISSVEQKNLGGNTDRLAPIQKSPIPEFSMFGS